MKEELTKADYELILKQANIALKNTLMAACIQRTTVKMATEMVENFQKEGDELPKYPGVRYQHQ